MVEHKISNWETGPDMVTTNRLERNSSRHKGQAEEVGELIQEFLEKIPNTTDEEEKKQEKIYLYSSVRKELGDNWIYDHPTLSLIFSLVYFFAENEKFLDSSILGNREKANLAKGILMFGNTGLGKTEIVKAFAKSLKGTDYEFLYLEVGTICERWEKDEDFRNKLTYSQQTVCIDDLGMDQVDALYKYKNPIPSIIARREKLWKNAGVKTIFITNFEGKELLEFYSARIVDRIVGMSNILKMKGESKR